MSWDAPPGFKVDWLKQSCGRIRLLHGGSGPPLVMLHGLGGSAEDFHLLAPALATTHRVFICDLPGFGLSDKPDASYSPAWFVDALDELCQTLAIAPAYWVGHSMGGMLALRLAAQKPALVQKAAAICPAGGQEGLGRPYRLLALLLAKPGDRLRFFHPKMLELSIGLIFQEPKSDQAKLLLQRLKKQWAGSGRRELERPFIRSGLGLLKEPLWPLARRIKCPVLVVTGSGDRVTPRVDTQRLLAALPPSREHFVLNCGHMPIFSRPVELAGLLRPFLEPGPLT